MPDMLNIPTVPLLPAPVLDCEQLARTVTRSARTAHLTQGENGARSLGLKPIGESSAYAMAVGVHPDIPNVVVKVVDARGDDAFWHYANAVVEGDIEAGPHIPDIMSITMVDDYSAIVLMERLKPLADIDLDEYTYDDTKGNFDPDVVNAMSQANSSVYQGRRDQDFDVVRPCEHPDLYSVGRWAARNDHALDLHDGNWMRRECGQLVLIDPVC